MTARPVVVGLSDLRATDPALVGAKAANLARCAAAGLPVLPGVVVTTAGTDRWGPGRAPPLLVLDLLRAAVDAGLPAGAGMLVVRSSSTVEDAERSSMAGRFRSVLDVSGWDGVVAAVRAVRDSAALDGGDAVSALAVLIQPQLAAEYGGRAVRRRPGRGRRRPPRGGGGGRQPQRARRRGRDGPPSRAVAPRAPALSHLAILARQLGVATVVGVPDARRRFPVGARVVVDGRSGEVRQLGDAAITEEEA